MQSFGRVMVGAVLLLGLNQARCAEIPAQLRIAMMDFSTDENSYRSIQAAAEFTSLVQLGLMGEVGIEWVERAQISLAKQEFALAGAKAVGGVSPLQRGRMLGADWMISGHFSLDARGQAILSLQVIELKYADVIAEETLALPDPGKEWVELKPNQVAFAVEGLRSLLAKPRNRQAELANQARVAFLFLADTSSRAESDRGTALLRREFSERLARTAATNDRIRLVQFPKAYQSTDEAEMAVDGIIASGQDSWNRTADVYVWGACAVTNSRTSGPMESWFSLTLNLWDGVNQPVTIKESFKMLGRGRVPPTQAAESINRLVNQVVSRAHPQRSESDSTMVRKQIADSIVKTYVATTRNDAQLGLHDREEFVQAVHMLETACYFNPDNADARVLWVTCRYGWWIDFGFNVKNQFWTKYRRSQAWGKYVDRFGLKPVGVELPFPYQQSGIPETYVGSLEDVVDLFPQWDSLADAAGEEQSRRQGVHTTLMEAEYHDFPKQMPAELVMKWKTELGDELTQRKKRVADYIQAQAASTNVGMTRSSVLAAGAISNQTSLPIQQRPVATLPVPQSSLGPATPVPAPKWLKNFMAISGLFRLYTPNALPNEIKPEVQVIRFPPNFEVKVIRQLLCHHDRLWVLAMDERSSPASGEKPDLSGETRDERNRLWTLEPEGVKPDLFKAGSLPAQINCFLFQGDQLWLAGDSVGVLDWPKPSFRKFGLAEGLAMKEVEALAVANGRVHAAGDFLKLSALDPVTARWSEVPLVSQTGMSHGSDRFYLLAGNQHWLAYGAGAMLFRNVVSGAWTNLAQIESARCFATDGAGFWIGADNGLHRYEPAEQALQSWNAPIFIESPMIGLFSSYVGGNGTLPQSELEQWEGQIRGRLRRLAENRERGHMTRKDQKAEVDPLRLNAHVPGRIAALANDGEFLWLGADNYFGSYLLLLHKPSLSLVANYKMAVRDRISSLAVSDKYVWAGTAYGDDSLVRLRKDVFLAVPQSQWVSIAIIPEDRERLIRNMSKRDQALYAFYAGDDARVVQLLGSLSPDKASLEELFLLAFSYDSLGLNQPEQCRRWFEAIAQRFPDSPWAKMARDALEESKSPVDATTRRANLLNIQLERFFKQFDQDGDQKLNRFEFGNFWRGLPAYFRVPPAVQVKRSQYDTNKDRFVDAVELQALVSDLRREQE